MKPYKLIVFDWNGTLSTGLVDFDHPVVSPLFDGVHDMLKNLSIHYELAIATFASRNQLMSELVHHGIDTYIKNQVCGDGMLHKPDAAVLESLMDSALCSPQETLMVGDTFGDMQCAINAGVDCILVHGKNAEWLEMFQEIIQLDKITDLPGWLAA